MKNFVVGQCYKDLFGNKYFCVDISSDGEPTLIPCDVVFFAKAISIIIKIKNELFLDKEN